MRKFTVYWRPGVLSFWYYLFSFPLINTALHILLWGDFFFLQIFMKYSFVKNGGVSSGWHWIWVFYAFFFFFIPRESWSRKAGQAAQMPAWAMEPGLWQWKPSWQTSCLPSCAHQPIEHCWGIDLLEPHGSPLLCASGLREEWFGGESCKLGHREARLFWGWTRDQTMSFANHSHLYRMAWDGREHQDHLGPTPQLQAGLP